ncbi:MAG: 16S rRNA (uracil(1498)-N(3))-methyltransferase [Proteobacteria bacterium]|nr:16S rRNA (uracil(1498)-N(3))-methyltransferase [Desulfobacula sp.]MBU4132082.1 16S rRNA (uracil(1498)-N(3))-methyltransferase [Pseudomonadota bacterium]
MQKFFIPNACMDGTNAVITGQDARHIHKVLRLKPGAPLCLTNGEGTDYEGHILSIGPDRVDVNLTAEYPSTTESSLHLTVCCAMLKDKKMDMVIKHLTQLGIVEWIPFFCERAIPAPDSKRLLKRVERWEAIVKESIKQCRRSCLVSIPGPKSFQEILDLSDTFQQRIAFWEKSSRPLAQLQKAPDGCRAILIIGPEGGFTDQEILCAQAKGFDSYSLGPRILRAETAAICATTLIQHLMGDI